MQAQTKCHNKKYLFTEKYLQKSAQAKYKQKSLENNAYNNNENKIFKILINKDLWKN